eukprot:COSAG02_NODE_52107_length_310_cov_0.507109_1_plen_95_part_10
MLFASKALRADCEVVLAALAQTPDALQYASPKLRADASFMRTVIPITIAQASRGGGGGDTGAAYDQDAVLAGFPTFANGASDARLNYLGWGGCQL